MQIKKETGKTILLFEVFLKDNTANHSRKALLRGHRWVLMDVALEPHLVWPWQLLALALEGPHSIAFLGPCTVGRVAAGGPEVLNTTWKPSHITISKINYLDKQLKLKEGLT